VRGRLARVLGRRAPASSPTLLTLSSVHDAVVGFVALAAALGGTAGVATTSDRAPRVESAASIASYDGVPMPPPSAVLEDGPVAPPASSGPAPAKAPDAPTPPSPPSLLPAGLLSDGGDTPEATNATSFAVSPTVEEDGTVFATATVLGCARPPCAAVFRSTDAGATWARLPATGFVGGKVLLTPTYPLDGRIFVAGPAGLQVSEDNGASFTTLAAVPGSAAVSPGFANDDPRIVVASSPLWEYRDDTEMAAPAPTLVGPSPATGGVAFGPNEGGRRLYLGGTALDPDGRQVATVFSCDRAVCDRRTSLGQVAGAPAIAVSPRLGDDLVFAWRGTALFRSPDGARSFERVQLPVAGTVADIAFSASGAIYAALTPAHGVPRGGLFASFDDGITWKHLGHGTELEEGATAVAALGAGRLMAAPALQGNGGILCSKDHGVTWSRRCAASDGAHS
nr:hypothetical protein [Actinomycetota bacterium]